ncbi:hypothetical protein F4604DRAFT_302727 [Suillus subluteus]|nr:hypothetical protein F4604DRAFT_359520 [Suillus subluteus]KAG1842333.1 hypothetical protein F4604DRAFT_302727 [Suillus subluteus]
MISFNQRYRRYNKLQQLALRPPIEKIQELEKEHKNLDLILQGTQRQNERCMAELDRVKTREKMLEQALAKFAGQNWQAALNIAPSSSTFAAPAHLFLSYVHRLLSALLTRFSLPITCLALTLISFLHFRSFLALFFGPRFSFHHLDTRSSFLVPIASFSNNFTLLSPRSYSYSYLITL